NVSHDIKTPLTSIINYVDLLQKEHTPEQEKEYLEVLERQSQRLKKLTEDVVEASKASTGNISVNLAPTNVREISDQALAEYKEKLDEQDLNLIMNMPDTPLYVLADGRLLWRVLRNLLGNIAKYAMPHSRVYFDVVKNDKNIDMIFKNTSRDELNITADELMERFVRGDRSRHTEGSGLGLNIARSLTELMGGTMTLTVDGDLFKVTVSFPAVTDRDESWWLK
ncbi:MAG: sensor histidine kinase, partial [Solobacterium sp.]|nr:sensor histidine kinase [Solobacterium sp.]